MSDPLRTVWDALERANCQPAGPSHQFRARCPAHDGKPDSLSVGVGADGRALVWCHVGCDAREVVRVLSLLWSDLFPDGHRHGRRNVRTRPAQRPVDLVLQALRALGIEYRSTTDPRMWVAARCPVCEADERYPLWVTENNRGRVGLSCFNGCPQVAVVDALAGVRRELAA